MRCNGTSADSSSRIILKTKNLQNVRISFFFLRNDTCLFSQTLHHRPRSSTNLRALTWNHILGDDPTLQGSCSRLIIQSRRWRKGVEAEHLPREITASRLGPCKLITLLRAQRQTMENYNDDAEWNDKQWCITLGGTIQHIWRSLLWQEKRHPSGWLAVM